jgi:predicted nucleotidyltransferase
MSDSLADYRATMKKREARARREQEERRERARTTARHVARYLRDTYGVSRVVLFGSMAQEGP